MPNILDFPLRVKRRCIGCGAALDKNAPAHHYACRRCFGYSRFRQAVDAFRRVRP